MVMLSWMRLEIEMIGIFQGCRTSEGSCVVQSWHRAELRKCRSTCSNRPRTAAIICSTTVCICTSAIENTGRIIDLLVDWNQVLLHHLLFLCFSFGRHCAVVTYFWFDQSLHMTSMYCHHPGVWCWRTGYCKAARKFMPWLNYHNHSLNSLVVAI